METEPWLLGKHCTMVLGREEHPQLGVLVLHSPWAVSKRTIHGKLSTRIYRSELSGIDVCQYHLGDSLKSVLVHILSLFDSITLD